MFVDIKIKTGIKMFTKLDTLATRPATPLGKVYLTADDIRAFRAIVKKENISPLRMVSFYIYLLISGLVLNKSKLEYNYGSFLIVR